MGGQAHFEGGQCHPVAPPLDTPLGESTCKKWAKLNFTAATKTHAWLHAAIDALEDWHSTFISKCHIGTCKMLIRSYIFLMSVMWNTVACYVNDKLPLYWLADKFKPYRVNTGWKPLWANIFQRVDVDVFFISQSLKGPDTENWI